MENIVTLNILSIRFYLLDFSGVKLLIDTGWAGTLPRLRGELRRNDVDLADIQFVMMTHHHPDHAGLLQDIKNASGARLLIHEVQVPYLKDLAALYEGKNEFLPVQIGKNDLVLTSENREVLNGLGILGEILLTPGHSEDSVSFVTDSGLAFIGDLTPPDFATEESAVVVTESWRKLLDRQVKTIYPAHSEPFPASQISL